MKPGVGLDYSYRFLLTWVFYDSVISTLDKLPNCFVSKFVFVLLPKVHFKTLFKSWLRYGIGD